MNTKKLLITLLAAGFLFTGCGLKDHKAIIKINNHAITQKDFDTMMEKAATSSPIAGLLGDPKKNKDGMFYLMASQRIINQLIVQELLDQEAAAQGVKVTSKDVDKAVEEIIEKVGSKEKLLEVLKQNNVNISDFKKDLKNQVKYKKLASQVANIEVTDKDCEDFYKQNTQKFNNPEQVRASHILIEANEYKLEQELTNQGKKDVDKKELIDKINKKMAEQKELALKLSKELKADKTKFPEYAKKYSMDKISAMNGGDLGFFDKGKMVPEFAAAAFTAKPNTVSDPVKTQFGYHIIMVTDRREAGIVPFEKAKSDIKEYLVADRQIKALDEITEAAKKKAKIEYASDEYNPEVIEKRLNEQLGGLKEQLGVPGAESQKSTKESANKPKAKK